jgi:S-(hydroxymethyl)glutathione dehydrogenase/alcohol dehydrogenase
MCEVAWSVDGTLLDGTSRMSLADGTTIQHFLWISCLAERIVVPSASVVPIPTALSWQHAALLGCGAVTGSGAVRNAAGVRPGESVCVVGCGGVGLHVLLAARRAGADPIVGIDVDESKLERAVAKGATHVLRGDDPNVAAAALALVPDGFDHAFDVAGRPDAIRLAFDVLRPGAMAIVVGISPADAEVSLPAQEFLSEKAIRGSFYGSGDPARELADLAVRAAAHPAELEGMVSHVTDLDGIEEAFDRLRRGEGARTIVVPDPGMA